MKVHYCDLCGIPLKEDFDTIAPNNTNPHYYIMAVLDNNDFPDTSNMSNRDYISYLKRIESKQREICPKCKEILDNLFQIRFNNMYKLEIYLREIFSQKTKTPAHETKRKKSNTN